MTWGEYLSFVLVLASVQACEPAPIPIAERSVRTGRIEGVAAEPAAPFAEEEPVPGWEVRPRSRVAAPSRPAPQAVAAPQVMPAPVSGDAEIRAAVGNINDCMQPTAAGEVSLQVALRLGPAGRAISAQVTGASDEAADCFEQRLLAHRYALPPGAVSVAIPLRADVTVEEVRTTRTVRSLYGNGFPLQEGETFAE